jgi:hypothetical protein
MYVSLQLQFLNIFLFRTNMLVSPQNFRFSTNPVFSNRKLIMYPTRLIVMKKKNQMLHSSIQPRRKAATKRARGETRDAWFGAVRAGHLYWEQTPLSESPPTAICSSTNPLSQLEITNHTHIHPSSLGWLLLIHTSLTLLELITEPSWSWH